MKVMLVDDEVGFRETVSKRLKKRKVDLVAVGSGEEALEHLRIERVDIVVLDMKMPGMDGIQTLRAIKTVDPLIEVVILTGHASLEAAKDGMSLGAFDYLMKPVDLDELLYRIQDAYKRKSIQETKAQGT